MNFEPSKTFKEQRLDRLKDSISEYLDDDGGTPQEFLDDLQRALLELREYFQSRADAYTHIQDFFK